MKQFLTNNDDFVDETNNPAGAFVQAIWGAGVDSKHKTKHQLNVGFDFSLDTELKSNEFRIMFGPGF